MPEFIDIEDALYRALAEPIGLILFTEDPARLRSAFHTAKVRDPQLNELRIYNYPNDPNRFFVCKREIADAAREARKADPQSPRGGLGLPDGGVSSEGDDDI